MVNVFVGVVLAVVAIIGAGSFLLFRGRRLLGANPLLVTGHPASAVIRSVRDTGATLQFAAYAVMGFVLEIEP